MERRKRKNRRSNVNKYLIDNELNDSILYTCGLTGMIAMQDLLQSDISISMILNNLLRICANRLCRNHQYYDEIS